MIKITFDGTLTCTDQLHSKVSFNVYVINIYNILSSRLYYTSGRSHY